ncbi:unnamed protein product [Prorocentrum cordatum]|uniref:Uncharacterized protein n=1 Tax=Prorocentrum cordatum TaxID=2364126 RepID=A0ABN9SZU1_9DINO|nr:unnamed protein product [Polarella glacialis]
MKDDFEDYKHYVNDASPMTLPWKRTDSMFVVESTGEAECFYYDILEDMCIPIYASQSEHPVAEEDFAKWWDLIEPADHKEISSYVQHDCFRPRLKTDCATDNFIDSVWLMEKKFGKITRKKMPFTHLGCEYTRTSNGCIFINQDAYLDTIKVGTFPKLMQYMTTGIIDLTRTTSTGTTTNIKKQNEKPITIRNSSVKMNFQEIDLVELSEGGICPSGSAILDSIYKWINERDEAWGEVLPLWNPVISELMAPANLSAYFAEFPEIESVLIQLMASYVTQALVGSIQGDEGLRALAMMSNVHAAAGMPDVFKHYSDHGFLRIQGPGAKNPAFFAADFAFCEDAVVGNRVVGTSWTTPPKVVERPKPPPPEATGPGRWIQRSKTRASTATSPGRRTLSPGRTQDPGRAARTGRRSRAGFADGHAQAALPTAQFGGPGSEALPEASLTSGASEGGGRSLPAPPSRPWTCLGPPLRRTRPAHSRVAV